MQATAALLEIKQDLQMGGILPPHVLGLLQAKRAAKAEQDLKDENELFAQAADSLGLMEVRSQEFASLLGGKVAAVGLKSRDGGSYKITHKYNGNAALACDLVRSRIVIDADQVPMARALLALHETVVNLNDLIAKGSKTGLQILNAKVTLPNGHKGEIQIITPRMYEAMQQTHGPYKKIHELTNQFADAAIPLDVSNKISELRSRCHDTHATGASLDRLHRFLDSQPS